MKAESIHWHATTKKGSCMHSSVLLKYLGKFSPKKAEVCQSLRKLTLVKVEWIWNTTYQKCLRRQKNYQRGCVHEILQWNKTIIHRNRCIWGWFGSSPTTNQRQHDLSQRCSARQQHLQAHWHLPARASMGQKGDTATLRWEALGILYGLVKFHNYCFAREEVFMDHKPFMAIFKKGVAILSQRLQQILLEYICTGSESYTNQDQTCSWQIGCPGKIIRKIKMKKLRACKQVSMPYS